MVAGPATAVGGVIGAVVAPDQWRDVDPRAALRLSDRLRVGIDRGRHGGLRLAASVRF